MWKMHFTEKQRKKKAKYIKVHVVLPQLYKPCIEIGLKWLQYSGAIRHFSTIFLIPVAIFVFVLMCIIFYNRG